MNADRNSFFEENDNKINRLICRFLPAAFLVIPLLALGSYFGLYAISQYVMMVLFLVGLFVTNSPWIFRRMGMKSSALKYYSLIVVSVLVCMMACNHDIGIWITYMLGAALSLLYFDPKLTRTICLVDYVLMLIAVAFRMNSVYQYFALTTGLSMEFLLVSVLLYLASRTAREHLLEEDKLLRTLTEEQERYRAALENSSDVFYEYDITGDVFCYYGSPSDTGESKETIHVVEHVMEALQEGRLTHAEDIGKVLHFIATDASVPIEIRGCHIGAGDRAYSWISVDGNVLYENQQAVKIIGRMRNISQEKEQEKTLLEISQKDSLTGFYQNKIGLRIIEQGYGRTDQNGYSAILLLKLQNLDQIEEKMGKVFCDAVIRRAADVLTEKTTEEDVLVRLQHATMLMWLQKMNSFRMEGLVTEIETDLYNVYRGEDAESNLDFEIQCYNNLEEIPQVFFQESEEEQPIQSEMFDYKKDMISFGFNILERTRNLQSSIHMLLSCIGVQYRFTSVRIFYKPLNQPNGEYLYEWTNGQNTEKEKIEELSAIYGHLKKEDHLVVKKDSGFSVLYCAFIEEDEVIGHASFEKRTPDFVWTPEIINELVELSRIMSTYILKGRADSASRAKSNFLSSMSHEIRTPMNAIAGFSELILHEEINDSTRKYAADIRQSANNLLSVINDILDFSKIESGKFEIDLDQYEIMSVWNDVIAVIRVRLDDKKVKLVTQIDPLIPKGMIGDSSRIRQVLINLLNNAVKYTNEGEIRLKAVWEPNGEKNGNLHVSIQDTGIGIREEDIGKLFQSFSQVDTKKNKKAGGTGLGLAISKNLLDLMNGEISVSSVYGEGSEFSFVLPQEVCDNTPSRFQEKSEETQSDLFAIPFTAPEAKILIVDDNRVNLAVATGLLKQYQVQITTALSGQEAIDVLSSDDNFDIVFMDHMMPEMDGIEATRLIRQNDKKGKNGLIIVALTANAIKGVEQEFLAAGMDGFLSKPINLRELAATMERWIPEEKKNRILQEDAAQSDYAKEETDEFKHLAGIDVTKGLKEAGDKAEYAEALRSFGASDMLLKVNRFYKLAQLKEYSLEMHHMALYAERLGAADLAKTAYEIEECIRNTHAMPEDALHREMAQNYRVVVDSIRSVFMSTKEEKEQLSEIGIEI